MTGVNVAGVFVVMVLLPWGGELRLACLFILLFVCRQRPHEHTGEFKFTYRTSEADRHIRTFGGRCRPTLVDDGGWLGGAGGGGARKRPRYSRSETSS
jgi:hypothetical protein